MTIIKLEEDDNVVPATVGSATENDENVVQSASIDEAGGRERGTAHNNLQQTTAIDEPPQHRYGTCSSRRLFLVPEGATLNESAAQELQKLETQMNLALFKIAKEFDNGFKKAMLAMIESELTGAMTSRHQTKDSL